MSERERDEHSGTETTGHEWDGIKELDTPLPRWWLWVWYGSMLASVIYWILMPAWPGLTGYTRGILGKSDRAEVVGELKGLAAQRQAGESQLRSASLQEIEADPELQAYAMQVGTSVFGDNCATCHGAGGAGGKGYPNLRDDVWLWGGKLDQIRHTIQVGVRSGHANALGEKVMPAFGRDQLLTEAQIGDLTEYVVALSGRKADAAAVGRARQTYADQCSACHGPAGTGDATQGIPNLTDAEWLFGSDRTAIHDQIFNGRNGVMPTWEARFSPETIKALAVYVHANAGGVAEPVAPPAPAPVAGDAVATGAAGR
ncbi:MAG: cytochrome-c oxidase, cbb3-type subunit III [Phenylobacterium sp. RIFCSPHIGHO2_01_FULL_69_31]|uniref:cytochrome-c oxidase, cbb3-type subunit III n=1 Tax=Phenylobacterium sp. RIFCSPHIGHO2_01_FULL_69_31 TaxID=1801944 RepID=UPI0008D633E5|nr:cytochrome-c oxidase, cbb3-type subunit III [Phenylobacterium sp. RIFCSPHIGHO2_01_FULL_69_31]OHB30696.1 MAG: cytochrome-c oxidase, cbb3-type subunit III [Phenylobacterium sp. RIFCSPHIGHO2_01_FULL_69_31]